VILPTKRVSADRALVALGAEVLSLLDEPKTVSRLWDEFKQVKAQKSESSIVTFDWFVLALDFLYLCDAVEAERGRIWKHTP